jgi:hypothetical protein
MSISLRRGFGIGRHAMGRQQLVALNMPARALSVDSIQSSRAERTRKRLQNIVKKSWNQYSKTQQKVSGAMDQRCEEMKERYGFTIHEAPGEQTVSLIREDKKGKWEIRIEFEAYKTPDEYDENALIMIFDIIARHEGKEKYLVFTCTPDPSPTLLSVRVVPSDCHHLDQTVYDGPNADKISSEISRGLFGFLKRRGVDLDVFRFVKDYAVHRRRTERVASLEGTVDFLAEAAAP